MYLGMTQDAMSVKILHYSIDSDYGIVLGWDLSHFILVLSSLLH